MSETETEIETNESRDEKIYTARLLGGSSRAVAERFNLKIADVDAVVDGKMIKLDNGYRLRAMALDLERLEAMQARFLRDALQGDLAAGHLCLKIAERRAAMLGYDSPMRIDVTQVQAVPQQTSTDKLRAALDRLMGKPQPPAADQDESPEPDEPLTH